MGSSSRADAVIREHVSFATTAGVMPVPVADVLTVTAIQVTMVARLADAYATPFSPHLARSLIASLTGTGVARLGASALKALPGVGSLIGIPAQMVLAGASTFAVGKLFKAHFALGGTLDQFRPDQMRRAYSEYVAKGRGVVRDLRRERAQGQDKARPRSDRRAGRRRRAVHDLARTLQRLVRLRDSGELSREEYDRLRGSLLERANGSDS